MRYRDYIRGQVSTSVLVDIVVFDWTLGLFLPDCAKSFYKVRHAGRRQDETKGGVIYYVDQIRGTACGCLSS